MEAINDIIWSIIGLMVAFLIMLVVFGFYFAIGVSIAIFSIRVGILPAYIGGDIPTTLVLGSVVMCIGIMGMVHFYIMRRKYEHK